MNRVGAILVSLLSSALVLADDVVGVSITISDIPSPDATVVAGLFDSAETLRAGKDPVRSASFATPGTGVTWQLDDLAPGGYGLLAYQDLNGNAELDLDQRGRPLEPYAVSGKPGRGAPRFERARIEINNNTQAVRLDRWRVRDKNNNKTRRESSS